MLNSVEGRGIAIADLMIAVALIGLAVLLVSRPIHGRDDLEPNLISRGASPPELLLRIAGFAGVPLFAIAWHRRRGRRGIIAGLLAGTICYGGYILGIDPYLPHYDLDRFPVMIDFLYFSLLGAAHGLILGLATWGLAALANISGMGRPARRQTASPGDGLASAALLTESLRARH
jgi:hypothetical protein